MSVEKSKSRQMKHISWAPTQCTTILYQSLTYFVDMVFMTPVTTCKRDMNIWYGVQPMIAEFVQRQRLYSYRVITVLYNEIRWLATQYFKFTLIMTAFENMN